MEESELRLIQPGMDVEDVDGEEIGTVLHILRDEAAPARYGRTGRATLAGWETGDLPAGC